MARGLTIGILLDELARKDSNHGPVRSPTGTSSSLAASHQRLSSVTSPRPYGLL